MPRISVLMAVYNGERYLREAVDSILDQTFTDFEFLIVDDGSTDDTSAVLDCYTDSRIVRLRNDTNVGLTKSLNRGLLAARGEYVARQDADDLSLLRRLASQTQFLDSHPDISLVGTGFLQIDEEGQELGTVMMPLEPDQIREMLFYAHCFCHGSVMAHRADLQAVGGYDERFVTAQDTDMWLRLAERHQLANLPTPLYCLRMHSKSVTGQSRPLQKQMAHQAMAEAMTRCLMPPDSWKPSALTLGRFHFDQALQALEDGCSARAYEQVIQARKTNLRLDDDADYLVRTAVQRAFSISPGGLSGLELAQDAQASFSFVHELFDLLPRDLESLHAKRRWVVSELYTAYAFAAFKRKSRTLTMQYCMKAWYLEPSRLKHRGLLSVFVRSLVGSRSDRGVS